jgi:HlyD family secretion protein
MIKKILKAIFKHKFITLIIFFLIVGGIYVYYKKNAKKETALQYTISSIKKGSLIISVSGSGQVSASNQVEIKPKVSGDLVSLRVENGQEVKAGELLMQIDTTSVQKEVRDAETDLETAKLDLEELLKPTDEYTLMQAENSLIDAKDSLTKLKFTQQAEYDDLLNTIKKAEDDLEKSYEDAFNSIANTFLDLPTIITGVRDILYSEEIVDAETYLSQTWNKAALLNSMDTRDYDKYQKMEDFIEPAETAYASAREKYDENFENYKNTSRYSEKEDIENLLIEIINTVKLISETIKREANMLDYWVDYRSQKNLKIYSIVSDYQSDLNSYTSKTNSHLSGLLSNQRSIEDCKKTKSEAERDLLEMKQNNPLNLAATERNVKEKEEALSKLKEEPDELEVRAKKITIQQKEDLLADARESLFNHYIRAPFDGIVTDINVKRGESVSSSTTLFTLITKEKLAEITLNEIDIAKVMVGQPATIALDALDDLAVAGIVAEIDTIGTISSGVVTYDVRISLDSQDERIKPGMSLSAEIITTQKDDVLLVLSSAIKQGRDGLYVQTVELISDKLVSNKPENRSIILNADLIQNLSNQPVQIGLSNDTMTEILDGLEENDNVIIQTISSSNASNNNQMRTGTGIMIPGMTGGQMRQFTR